MLCAVEVKKEDAKNEIQNWEESFAVAQGMLIEISTNAEARSLLALVVRTAISMEEVGCLTSTMTDPRSYRYLVLSSTLKNNAYLALAELFFAQLRVCCTSAERDRDVLEKTRWVKKLIFRDIHFCQDEMDAYERTMEILGKLKLTQENS